MVLLHGFGVGSFHFESQLQALAAMGFAVYAADNVGAGLSWPSEDVAPRKPADAQGFWWGFGDEPQPQYKDLVIGEGLWLEQAKAFIRECVEEPEVHLCGNSLGGYLATLAAADLLEEGSADPRIRGLVLLNATPIWGFTPNPERQPFLNSFFPWSGALPVPGYVRVLAETWYNALRDPGTVGSMLKLVTASPASVGEKVPQQIATMASHPGGASAFAQILFSPKSPRTFGEALRLCADSGLRILLLYGADDPFVNTVCGHCAKLDAPGAAHWQLAPSGHCPHHETPKAVNEALRRWFMQEDGAPDPHLAAGSTFEVAEDDGRRVTVTAKGTPDPFGEGAKEWDEFAAWSWVRMTQAL